MNVYESGKPSLNNGHLTQSELHLYGSSRLGLLRRNLDVGYQLEPESDPSIVSMPLLGSGDSLTFGRGNKLFELNNHLGNVLLTVNDKKLGVSSNNTTVDYYNPQVASAQDYYPFGMLQPGRSMNVSGYRYGFNRRENDNEVKGEGNQQDYGMRVYDPRLGRFLSEDPLLSDYPELTPYQFSGNNPILFIDLDGLEPALPGIKNGELQKAKDNSTITAPNLKPSTDNWFVWITDYSGVNGKWEKTSEPTTVTFMRPSKNQSVSNAAKDYPTAMINVASQFLGVNEVLPNGKYNPVVQGFIHSVRGLEKNNNTVDLPWCSCFMNYVMEQTGRKGTEDARALSWREWGVEIQGPVVGAITSIAIGNQGKGHVNFVVGKIGERWLY